ncbi:MAG: hypothetical protein ACLSCX_05465, partial [Oscillospiraceae bacterium]
ELVVTVIAMVVSRLLFIRRRNALMQYVQSATDAEGISVHAGSPFPMAVIRLPEGEIIWGNEGFYAITGLSDGCRYQTLESVVPGFTTGWLREGRNELPRSTDRYAPLPDLRQLRPLGGRRDDGAPGDHLLCRYDGDVQRTRRVFTHAPHHRGHSHR